MNNFQCSFVKSFKKIIAIWFSQNRESKKIECVFEHKKYFF